MSDLETARKPDAISIQTRPHCNFVDSATFVPYRFYPSPYQQGPPHPHQHQHQPPSPRFVARGREYARNETYHPYPPPPPFSFSTFYPPSFHKDARDGISISPDEFFAAKEAPGPPTTKKFVGYEVADAAESTSPSKKPEESINSIFTDEERRGASFFSNAGFSQSAPQLTAPFDFQRTNRRGLFASKEIRSAVTSTTCGSTPVATTYVYALQCSDDCWFVGK